MEKIQSAGDQPLQVELEAGKVYNWCQCGRSKNQPFCDMSHVGTGILPKTFKVTATRKVWLCMCKHTKTVPYCDGSHARLK